MGSYIAVLSEGYLPGFKSGGPIVSVSRIIDRETTHQFKVITCNHDLGDAHPYSGLTARTWKRVGRADVAYLRPRAVDIPWIIMQLRSEQPDSYYINSLHSPWFSLLPLLGMKLRVIPRKPVLLAPRGETSKGALGLKSRKKNMWRQLIKWLIGSEVTWHFSSKDEQNEVRSWWVNPLPPNHRSIIQANPADPPANKASTGPTDGIPVIVFASRIDPMKGLYEAIQIVSQLDFPLKFHVYGTVSDESYWRQCQAIASKFLTEGLMEYKGSYDPSCAQKIFADASLFLFPTKGENFGHVIAEALSVGCPVAITPTTPWTDTVLRGGGVIIKDFSEVAQGLRYLCGLEAERTSDIRRVAHAQYSNWYAYEHGNGFIFD